VCIKNPKLPNLQTNLLNAYLNYFINLFVLKYFHAYGLPG
jgi:hypothetical protein